MKGIIGTNFTIMFLVISIEYFQKICKLVNNKVEEFLIEKSILNGAHN